MFWFKIVKNPQSISFCISLKVQKDNAADTEWLINILIFTSKLKPLAYYEGYFEEDDDREYTLTYHYDSQGFLESAYND